MDRNPEGWATSSRIPPSAGQTGSSCLCPAAGSRRASSRADDAASVDSQWACSPAGGAASGDGQRASSRSGGAASADSRRGS